MYNSGEQLTDYKIRKYKYRKSQQLTNCRIDVQQWRIVDRLQDSCKKA